MTTSNSPSFYFKVIHCCFKITGLWINSSNRKLNIKIVISYLIMLSISFLAVTHKFYLTANDLSVGTEVLLHVSLLFHTLVTYLILLWNQKIIMRMYSMVESNFNHFYKLFNKTNKYQLIEEKGSAIVTITVASVISTAHISYMYVTRFYVINLDYTEKELIYPISLPFDLDNSTYYIVIVIEFATTLLDFAVHITSICICTGFINILCAELYLLAETFAEITSVDESDTKYLFTINNEADLVGNEQIKMWVIQHNLLIE